MFLAPIFLLTIAFVIGEFILNLLRRRTNVCEASIIGSCFIFVSFECLFLLASHMGFDFLVLVRMYSIFLCAVTAAAFFMFSKQILASVRFKDVPNQVAIISVVLIVLIQIIMILIVYPQNTFDYTVEIVNTTIASNSMYINHPGTGQVLELGMKASGRYVSLPILYAYLADIFSANSLVLVYKIIPVWVLIMSFYSYSLIARLLFKDVKNSEMVQTFFLVGLGLLNLLGALSGSSVFHYQIYRGFKGETICYVVLMPYVIYLMYAILAKEDRRSIFLLILVLLASFSLCRYSVGLFPLLMTVAISIIVSTGYHLRRRVKCSL